MNTCKTCKHWKSKADNPAYWDTDVRGCDSGKLVFACGGRDLDCVVVSEDYASAISINTGPNFGCVHHELSDKNL